MKKKLFSLVLATAMMGSLLAGCGGSSTASGDPVTINIQFVGLHEENTDVTAVEDAINAITVPKINVKIHIEPLFIGKLATTTSLGIAGGEKMDIVAVGLTNPVSTMVAGGMLLHNVQKLLGHSDPKTTQIYAQTSTANVIYEYGKMIS